jgi:hypothetical protein
MTNYEISLMPAFEISDCINSLIVIERPRQGLIYAQCQEPNIVEP